MKNLVYKTAIASDGGNEKAPLLGVSKNTISMPKLNGITVSGNEEYVIIKGQKDDGDYWGGYFTFQQSDIVTLSEAFREWQTHVGNNNVGGWNSSIVAYLNTLTNYSSKDEQSVYGAFREKLRKELDAFQETDDSVFEVKITQSLQDTKKLDLLNSTWSNNIENSTEFINTYKQGAAPMFLNKPAIISSIIACANCDSLETGGTTNPYNTVGSSYPGANISVFESAGFMQAATSGALDILLLEVVSQKLIDSCDLLVERIKGEEFDKKAKECDENLKQEKKDVEDLEDSLKEDLDGAVKTRDQDKVDLDDATEQLNKEQEALDAANEEAKSIEEAYAKCLEAATTPAEIEACTLTYNDDKTENDENIAKIEAGIAELEVQIEKLKKSIAEADIEIANLENSILIAKEQISNIAMKLEINANCQEALDLVCGEEPPA